MSKTHEKMTDEELMDEHGRLLNVREPSKDNEDARKVNIRSIEQHLKNRGYGSGHNMSAHGEGKKHGEK
jgi:hypothetical protein